MNRRAFLRVLGLVPLVGPAVVKAMAAAPADNLAAKVRAWYVEAVPLWSGRLGQWEGLTFVQSERLPAFHSEAMPDCELPDLYDPTPSVEIIDDLLEAARERQRLLVVSPSVYETLRTAPGFVDVHRP